MRCSWIDINFIAFNSKNVPLSENWQIYIIVKREWKLRSGDWDERRETLTKELSRQRRK